MRWLLWYLTDYRAWRATIAFAAVCGIIWAWQDDAYLRLWAWLTDDLARE